MGVVIFVGDPCPHAPNRRAVNNTMLEYTLPNGLNTGCDPFGVVVAFGLSWATCCDPFWVMPRAATSARAFDPEGVAACSRIRSTKEAFDPNGVAAGVCVWSERPAAPRSSWLQFVTDCNW